MRHHKSPLAYPDNTPQIQFRGGNVQVNDPSAPFGDYIQIFPGFRPFVHATQSEVSAAASGRNIVVTYNNSAGLHVSPNPSGPGVVTDRLQVSGFSVSNDGGQTWKSGFIPPAAGTSETFGDPSVGVDRHGVFYFANLGMDAIDFTVQVNKSIDGGNTWSDGVVVQEDFGSDKEWLAVGPDPAHKNRDNVYVTWTSFQPTACELRFGRSIDGGETWTAKTIFVPTTGPEPHASDELPAVLEPGGRSDHRNALRPVPALQQCGPRLHPDDDLGRRRRDLPLRDVQCAWSARPDGDAGDPIWRVHLMRRIEFAADYPRYCERGPRPIWAPEVYQRLPDDLAACTGRTRRHVVSGLEQLDESCLRLDSELQCPIYALQRWRSDLVRSNTR